MYTTEIQKALFERSKDYLDTTKQVFKSVQTQCDELIELIQYHEWRYYILNQPVLSDFEYDSLFKQLEAIEKANPNLVQKTSPTQRVGKDLSNDFATVKHLTPTLSLDNSYNAEDLIDFDGRIHKLVQLEEQQAIAYAVEPKFDGGTIVLIYENDELQRAATRGDGSKGDEITANARAIYSIPLQAAFSKFGITKAELRGEVLIKKSNFDSINQRRATKGENLFANARNAATGGLRLKDPSQISERGLEAFVYQIGYAVDKDGKDLLPSLQSHHQTIELLKELGFKVPIDKVERKLCQNIHEVAQYCQDWEAQREEYGYEIDGMVIKVDELALQEQCGYTSHHPRWAIAYKFKAKQATTKLLDIEYQVGRTGAVTPVAKLETVELAGVSISSVSLHNADLIAEKDIRIGDYVLVERAGDVIPYIVKSMADLRDGSEQVVEFPKYCPVCGSPLVRPEGEAVWRCVNEECEAKLVGKLVHFVSKKAMNIDGFGEAYIEKFFEEGLLHSFTDIYRLDYVKIEQFEGFGKRSVEKLRLAIEASKENEAARLLYGLGIRFIGHTNAKLLVAEVEDIRQLNQWSEEDLISLKDIGPKVAQQVVNVFSNPQTLELLDLLAELGVNTRRLESEKKDESPKEGPLAGKTVLFTGKLQQIKRNEAKKMVEAAGGKAASGVSSKLSYLVAGEKAGSKLKKAQELNIAVLTEDEFLQLIKQ